MTTPWHPPPLRLAIVVSHPIQYYAPWFAHLTRHLDASVRVFYLWDFGVTPQLDPGFGREVAWDIDLLAGYDFVFVRNVAKHPGTDHFHGLDNPELNDHVAVWNPDAILLFGYKYKTHLRLMGSRFLRKVPMIFRGDSHLLAESAGPVRRAAKQLALQVLFRRFAAFLSVGSAHTAYLEWSGVPRCKIFHAPHAVDNQRFIKAESQARKEACRWKNDLQIPWDHRVILFAGKFEPKKCPDLLVRAFTAAKIPKATLVLVGNGIMESKLRELAHGTAHIHFVPFQNQLAMPQVYAAADLVVLPSQGPGESWGLVINEALCCGKAVIVSDHVGCQGDLVHHGRNGLVVRAGDQSALEDALTHALSDTSRLRQWGEQGRKIVSRYSYENATTGLKEALAALPILK